MIKQKIDDLLQQYNVSLEKRHQIKAILENDINTIFKQAQDSTSTLLLDDVFEEQEQVFPTTSSLKIGRYDDLDVIGIGAMGEVRRVFDHDLHRQLAIKIIHPELLQNYSTTTRFVEEAQIGAQLQHPNIVPIHEIGRLNDGRLYFTMKEIKGIPFGKAIADVHNAVEHERWKTTQLGWSFRKLLNAFCGVCNAIEYAHSMGVLHRDIKPENIMLGEYGEVLVVDWGIAKILGSKDILTIEEESSIQTHRSAAGSHATRVGQVAGTPAYMSPEQARGDINKLDERTDIYALGAVLYEILIGQPAYVGDDGMMILSQVISGPPKSIRTTLEAEPSISVQTVEAGSKKYARPPLPEELVAACEKAMSRDLNERYSSVNELSKVISDWLDGAKKREQALKVVDEAMDLTKEREELRRRSRQLAQEAEEGLREIPEWEGEHSKEHWWEKERTSKELMQRSQLLDVIQEHTLKGALTHKSDLEEAHVALARRYRTKHKKGEEDRDNKKVYHAEINLHQHATALHEGHSERIEHLTYLQGTGSISITTNIEGVNVSLEKFVPHRRRLIPKFIAQMGVTPIQRYPLAMGSYLLRFTKEGHQEVLYPVSIGRGEHWDCVDETGTTRPVYIPKEGELQKNECYVPAGWFWIGGDDNAPGSFARRRIWQDSFVISKFPVTNREYLCFLNDLVQQGRGEEATCYVPREKGGQASPEGEMIYGRDVNNLFVLTPDSNGDIWNPEWPVCMLDWHSCTAFTKWKATQTGHSWRLPSEIEWEKSARGVDGRYFSWGDGFDASYSCMGKSHKGKRLPVAVDSFPIDESVYGVRGMCGNMVEWTSSIWIDRWGAIPVSDSKLRVYRGGGWYGVEFLCRLAYRYWYDSSRRLDVLSFRLARDLQPK